MDQKESNPLETRGLERMDSVSSIIKISVKRDGKSILLGEKKTLSNEGGFDASNTKIPLIRPRKRFSRKRLLISAGLIFICGILILGVVCGVGFYERTLKKISIKKILSGNVDLVITFPASPDDQQYQTLEGLIDKFPGGKLFLKKIVENNSGDETTDQSKSAFEELGISFEEDIRPVMGKTGYIIIPTLDALEDRWITKLSIATEETARIAQELTNQGLAINGRSPIDIGKVLGETKEIIVQSENEASLDPDFILAFEIKNIFQAKKILKKMSRNNNLEMNYKKYKKYSYVEVIPDFNIQSKSDPLSQVTNRRTYHAMLGGNWITTTSENELRLMIEKGAMLELMNQFLGKFQSERLNLRQQSLAENKQYQETQNRLVSESDNNLFSFYYRFLSTSIGEERDCSEGNCDLARPLIKYPDELITGASLAISDGGLMIRTLSNQYVLGNISQTELGKGIEEIIPEKLKTRWTDMFLEHSNIKDVYYSFKKNALTDEGRNRWDQITAGVAQMAGIDMERDIVDQISGPSALILLSREGQEPHEILIVTINDQKEAIRVIGELVDFAKQTYANFAMAPFFQEQEICTQSKSAAQCLDKKSAVLSNYINEILDSEIKVTEVSDGTIYSYKLPGTDISFDFSFANNMLILGSHYESVKGMIIELANSSEQSLSENRHFEMIAGQLAGQGYTKFFASTNGFWNVVKYYIDKYYPEDENQDFADTLIFSGAILRTINLMGSLQMSENQTNVGSLYFNIEKLPAKEFELAEEIINKKATK